MYQAAGGPAASYNIFANAAVPAQTGKEAKEKESL
jgi:hypothetical protein